MQNLVANSTKNKVIIMINSFSKNGKEYFPKTVSSAWAQWGCKHEDGQETWACVRVSPEKIRRVDVINAIDGLLA